MAESAGSIYYSVDIETQKTLKAQSQLDQGFDSMQNSMDRTDAAGKRLSGGLSKLATAIGAVIAAGALRDMAGLVQKYQEMSERVQMATASQSEFEMVQRRLMDTANGTYRSLEEAQELYIRTADSLRSMGYSTQQALDVTDSMSFAFVKNATSADRASSAISAFSKSMNTGKVAADQWETITSAIPTVIDDIADAAGKSSAEIRALGAAGKLTGAQLSEGLRKSLEANTEAAGKMAANMTDAGVRVKTALTVMLVSLEQQTGGLQALTDGIVNAANVMLEFGGDAEKMASFLNTATTAATAFAAVIAGRMLQATGAYALAQVQAIQATTARMAADQAAAAGALRRAGIEKISALAALEVARSELAAAAGTNAHAFAANALIAAQTRAATAAGAYAAAQTAANGVARVGTVVMTGLSRAMMFLGGPLGVVLLAATALYAFSGSARDAKPPTDDLTKSVQDLSAAQRDLARFEAIQKIEELSEQSRILGDNMKYAADQTGGGGKRSARFAEDALRVKVALEETNKQLETYQQRVKDIDAFKPGESAPASSGEPTPIQPPAASDKAAKAAVTLAEKISDQVAELQFQADTLGMTTSELEIYKLELLNASDAQIQAAQSSLSLIDAYNMQEEAADKAAEAESAKNKQLQEAAKTVTPLRAAENQYSTDLQQYQEMLALKLISDQEYMMLKNQAETEFDAQRMAAQEAMFASQSAGHTMLMDGINALGAGSAQVFSGILSGSMSGEEAMQSLANTILNSVISSIVQMGIEQIKTALIGKAVSAAAAAGYIASVSGQVAANTALAAQAAFASTAAIPIVGPALAGPAAAAAGAAAASLGAPAIAAASSTAAGRALGGPVQADNMYRINETGGPEIFNAANGRQYMMPNQRGEVVSNKDASGNGGGTKVEINIQNHTGQKVTQSETQMDDKRVIDIIVGDIMGDGKTSKAIQRTTGTRRVGA